MNKLILFLPVLFSLLLSCERDGDEKQSAADSSVFFRTEDGIEYSFSDFEFYDSSSYLFYFKNIPEETAENELSHFAFLHNGDTIYSGVFWPMYFNSIPEGPFIIIPQTFYGDFVLGIENWLYHTPDPRNGGRMIDVLKSHGLLHSGLACRIDTIYSAGNRLTYSFTVTNKDLSDLLILDPDKMGQPLFHYFTNGLYLYDADHIQLDIGNTKSKAPVPWDSWNISWLSELKSGKSKHFTIYYTMDSPLDPGVYQARFAFPGLNFQVRKEDLYQGNGRVWLGDIQTSRLIHIR